MRGPVKKGRSPGSSQTISKVKQMFTTDDTTTVKTVKISASKSLKACERIIFADGKPIKFADIAQRQGEHHLYQADIILLDEQVVLETSAPCWARVEVE